MGRDYPKVLRRTALQAAECEELSKRGLYAHLPLHSSVLI
jgi:hypothetical protein